ncbi:pentapeptide repeat-containing protein [Allocoprobacillus halotolerans]|uniref:pentapeptide repeat-containing protein n=1 Tax=Allocoprobacillus halotolerans TaxID=2944914 RepID=UPI00338E5E74
MSPSPFPTANTVVGVIVKTIITASSIANHFFCFKTKSLLRFFSKKGGFYSPPPSIFLSIALRGVVALRGVALRGVALRGVALRGVALRGVALRGVALRGVALRGVALRGVALRGVALRGVALRGVALRGVALRGVYIY